MYNRYIPTADGTYKRQIMHAKTEAPVATQACNTNPAPHPVQTKKSGEKLSLPISLETEDLLVLLILAVVLLGNHDGDNLPLIVTMAAFILLG